MEKITKKEAQELGGFWSVEKPYAKKGRVLKINVDGNVNEISSSSSIKGAEIDKMEKLLSLIKLANKNVKEVVVQINGEFATFLTIDKVDVVGRNRRNYLSKAGFKTPDMGIKTNFDEAIHLVDSGTLVHEQEAVFYTFKNKKIKDIEQLVEETRERILKATGFPTDILQAENNSGAALVDQEELTETVEEEVSKKAGEKDVY